jgi:signal transduction histidine kinase
VEETLSLVSPELDRNGISVETGLEASEDTVVADFVQLKGVFLNLLLNAADAMPTGGTLRIRSEALPTGRIAVHVGDEGPGIPSELRERVFEPFFTTKSDGSGIGLSLALQTVEDHGGRLYVEKRAEHAGGAEFVVELPLLGAISAFGPEDAPARTAPLDPGAPQRSDAHDQAPAAGATHGGSTAGGRNFLPSGARSGTGVGRHR